MVGNKRLSVETPKEMFDADVAEEDEDELDDEEDFKSDEDEEDIDPAMRCFLLALLVSISFLLIWFEFPKFFIRL